MSRGLREYIYIYIKFLNVSDLLRCKPLVMVALPSNVSSQPFSLDSSVSMAVHPHESSKVNASTLTHVSLGHFSLFLCICCRRSAVEEANGLLALAVNATGERR